MTRWLHAGAAAGMPLRCQLVLDYAVFDAAIWNSVMAECIIHDVAALPAGVGSEQQRHRAMRVLQDLIAD